MLFSESSLSRLGLMSLLFSAALAAPVVGVNVDALTQTTPNDLVKRAPIEATFKTDGWEDIAEENCRIMLCELGGKRIYRRIVAPYDASLHYTDSGASTHPFQDDQLSGRETSRINSATTSAEEFPWRSTQQGGIGAKVIGATVEQQHHQGNAIIAGYRGNGGTTNSVPEGAEFRITFTGPGATKQYCVALFKNPPDFSLCKNPKPEPLFNESNVMIQNYIYEKDSKSSGKRVTFKHPLVQYINERDIQKQDEEQTIQKRDAPEDFELLPISDNGWQGH